MAWNWVGLHIHELELELKLDAFIDGRMDGAFHAIEQAFEKNN